VRPTPARVAAAALATVLLTGCSIGSRPLPLTEGNGEGAYRVTVELENAVNLVPNAEVKVDDITVGSVRYVRFAGWHAELEVGLARGVVLPANAVAKIGQKSLLGAEYLELAPPTGEPAAGRLRGGDVIPLSRTGRYPETEELLASLSVVLNGGGLEQVRTITHELDRALHGREAELRRTLAELDRFVSTVDGQRLQLVRSLEALDRLGGRLATQRDTLDRALRVLPAGLATLERQRADLVRMLEALSGFGTVATRVVASSRADLVANVRALRPVLRELADAGRDLPQSLGMVTFPFPIKSVQRAFRGDYVNLVATFDLTGSTLERNFLRGTPLDGIYAGLLGGAPSGPAAERADPLRAPLDHPVRPRPAGSPSVSPSPSGTPSGGGLLDLLGPVGGNR
jgi:phospholipid/cholesterol/gamma-HCH transport system substrate-binding protein